MRLLKAGSGRRKKVVQISVEPIPAADDAFHLYELKLLVRAPAYRDVRDVWDTVGALIVLYGEGRFSVLGHNATMSNYTMSKCRNGKAGLIKLANVSLPKNATEAQMFVLTPPGKKIAAKRKKTAS